MGVTARDKLMLVANAMAKLGVRRAFVVHGSDGLDELTVTGESNLAEVHDRTVALYRTKPEDVGLRVSNLDTLAGGDAAANAAILEGIFRGEVGPRRDIVLFNAAAALVVAELAEDIVEGIDQAAAAVDSGAAWRTLEQVRQYSREYAGVRREHSAR
jgi:anthranilate phosphoribosyltransferase